MATGPSLGTELKEFYVGESSRIQRDFSASADGHAAVLARTAIVESIARRLWSELISPDPDGPRNFALVALGGFGTPLAFSAFGYRPAVPPCRRRHRKKVQGFDPHFLAGTVGPAAQVESRHPNARGMRKIRSEQCRICNFAARLPLSGGRSAAFRPASRQIDSQARLARVPAHRAAAVGSHARPLQQIWRHAFFISSPM